MQALCDGGLGLILALHGPQSTIARNTCPSELWGVTKIFLKKKQNRAKENIAEKVLILHTEIWV